MMFYKKRKPQIISIAKSEKARNTKNNFKKDVYKNT